MLHMTQALGWDQEERSERSKDKRRDSLSKQTQDEKALEATQVWKAPTEAMDATQREEKAQVATASPSTAQVSMVK